MRRARAISAAPDSGVIAPATAVVLAVLIGMVGLVTDTSVWFAQRRQLQGVTDAAAIAAAAYAANPSAARTAANNIFIANGLDPASAITSFTTGRYCPGSSAQQRFQAGACPGGVTSSSDAVRVSTGFGSPLFLSRLFSPGRTEQRIGAVATAARVNQAGIQAGTGVASLNAGIGNAVLSQLTGGSVSLSVAQYDGLLNANVDALTFLDALATRLNVTSGTYSQLLSSDVAVGNIIAAEIAALAGQSQVVGTSAAIAGLRLIQSQVAGTGTIRLGDMFDLGLWGSREVGGGAASASALHAGINLMQLTTFSLQLMDRQNVATVPSSSIGIPGLASIQIAATAIEKPARAFFSFGPEGTQVHSAQVRVKLNLEVLNLASVLGAGVSVPLYIEAASGDATIDRISCGGDPARDAQVKVSARSGVANVYIGAPSDQAMRNFSKPVAALDVAPVRILSLGVPGVLTLLDTAARAHVTIGSTSGAATALTFVQPSGTVVQPDPPTTRGVIGRAAYGGQAASPPVLARATSTSLGTNLLGGLAETLSVRACVAVVLGICVGGTLEGKAVGPLFTVLDPILTNLDGVLDGLLRSLGVQLGYVDVAVTGVRCGLPVLVS